MYTRCPHCTTIFRITAGELRASQGEVPCVTCAQPFSALKSLSDDITALISTPGTSPETNAAGSMASDPQSVDAEEASADTNTGVDPVFGPQPAEFAGTMLVGDDIATSDTDEFPVPTFAEYERGAEDSDDTRMTEDTPDADEIEVVEYLLQDSPDAGESVGAVDAGDAEHTEDAEEAEDIEDVDDPADTEDVVDTADTESPGEEADTDDPLDARIDSDIEPEMPFLTDEADAADEEQPVESMEFDAPEQTWTRFFLTNSAIASLEEENQKSIIEPGTDFEPQGPDLSIDDTIGQPWIGREDTGSFEFQTADQDEWRKLLADLGDDAAPATDEDRIVEEPEHPIVIDEPEAPLETIPEPEPEQNELDPEQEELEDEQEDEFDTSIMPLWLTEDTPEDTPQPEPLLEFRPSRSVLVACAALVLLLFGQMLHYNRDALASSNTYGAAVRGIYSVFGATLYPDWPLDAFEITGTEAIAGQSDKNALSILANVIVGGQENVGLPLIRIVLRDRWTNPVAARVFEPYEYLRAYDPANPLASPGTALPVEVNVADPGAAALGYVVDVCMPRRKTGLECQIARDPFQQ